MLSVRHGIINFMTNSGPGAGEPAMLRITRFTVGRGLRTELMTTFHLGIPGITETGKRH